ncbi:hypothetical protein SAE02_69160 [Skermanella aerolata]|uniref:Uncharacterized protein n=1 Tax=Skermanella aerolata TaxID=393310 RepID=A0A512E215_9PROT|nr:hypothetical protein N826_31995 [Skermanella aerolata KACC 11604]GEO42768.1 hypothetical protein SAE02_69160 [Skermanella aerolata]
MFGHAQDGSRAWGVVRVICRVMPVIVAWLPLIGHFFVIEMGVFGSGTLGKRTVLPNFRELGLQGIMRQGKDIRDGQRAEGHR